MTQVTVTQADREEAAGVYRHENPDVPGAGEGARLGDLDDCFIVQAFARHRTQSVEQALAPWVEAVEVLLLYIPEDIIHCNGDKCREPHCASCFGEDEAERGHQRAIADLVKYAALLATRKETDHVG